MSALPFRHTRAHAWVSILTLHIFCHFSPCHTESQIWAERFVIVFLFCSFLSLLTTGVFTLSVGVCQSHTT